MALALQTFDPCFEPGTNPGRNRNKFGTWLVARLAAVHPRPVSVADVAKELDLTDRAIRKRLDAWSELRKLVHWEAGHLSLTAAGLAHEAALSVRQEHVAAEAPVLRNELAVRDGRLAVQRHTTEMAELETRAARAQRETQRAQRQTQLDELRAERLVLEEVRKAGYKFLRGTPTYGQPWIDRYGRDPDMIEQIGLYALGRGGYLPPSLPEMGQNEWLRRLRSINSQTAGPSTPTAHYPRLPPATYVPAPFAHPNLAPRPAPAPLPADNAESASRPGGWIVGIVVTFGLAAIVAAIVYGAFYSAEVEEEEDWP